MISDTYLLGPKIEHMLLQTHLIRGTRYLGAQVIGTGGMHMHVVMRRTHVLEQGKGGHMLL